MYHYINVSTSIMPKKIITKYEFAVPHSLPPMEMMLLDQQSQADPPVQLQEAPRSHQNQALGDVENILAMLNNYKCNPWALTDEQIEQVSTIKTTLASVLRYPNPNSNTNFLPQHK